MVGPWPLALHQDYLQHMYPMYFNASGVKTEVLHPNPTKQKQLYNDATNIFKEFSR